MSKLKLALTSAAVLTLSLSSLFAANPMKAGKWQITTKTEMEGMPIKIPPVTITHCVKPEDLENPEKTLPKQQGSCKVEDYKIDGNTVSWKLNCPKEKMTGSGTITYTADSYSGTMNMDMSGQKLKSDMTGKLLGACDK